MQQPALTRHDHHRRAGSLGELDTVVERLDRVVEIWGDDEQRRWHLASAEMQRMTQ